MGGIFEAMLIASLQVAYKGKHFLKVDKRAKQFKMFKLALFQLVLATVVLIVAARPQQEAKKLNSFAKTQLNKEAKGAEPKKTVALNEDLYDRLLNDLDKDSSAESLNLGLNSLKRHRKGKETRKSHLNKLNAQWEPKSLPKNLLNLNSLGLNSYLNAQKTAANVEPEEEHQGKQGLNSLLSKLNASSSKPLVGLSSVFSTVHISGLNEDRQLQEDLLLALNQAKALEEIPA